MRPDDPTIEVHPPEGMDLADFEAWKRHPVTRVVLGTMEKMSRDAEVGSASALRRADMHQAVLQGGYHDGLQDGIEIVEVWMTELRTRAAAMEQGQSDDETQGSDQATDEGRRWD